MLPFPKNDGKRKYACFVCGIQFESFEEFTNHIVEEHEEGREYIKCPLERCQACVRCIKTHFTRFHPADKIPTNTQMRAIVWKDAKNPSDKSKTRKPRFRTGTMTSAKNGGKEMHYRSGMECEVYECLELIDEVLKYDVEPFAIKYSFKGEQHEYNPDISVIFENNRVEIWEVKPADQTSLPVNQAKWNAAKQHCEARGWQFRVINEVGIDKLKKMTRRINT